MNKFNISKTSTDKIFVWMLKNNMLLGMSIGSNLLGTILKYSRHLVFLGLNVLGIIACAISLAPNIWVLLIGRFLYGCVVGLLFGLVPKMLMEYLPFEEFIRGYGAIPNLAVEVFKTLFLVLNFVHTATKDANDTSPGNFWMVNYGFPAPFLIISTILFGIWSRHDSFQNLVKQGPIKK